MVYGLAKGTDLVRHDPVLWFSMMLMPGSPPAMIISGLAELAKISEIERMTIAKMLTVSFTLTLYINILSHGDHVRAVADDMLFDYGGNESVRGSVGAESK